MTTRENPAITEEKVKFEFEARNRIYENRGLFSSKFEI